MEIFALLIEGVKYALPAGLVLLAVYLLNKKNERDAKVQYLAGIKGTLMQQHMPLRLTAAERSVLFLDRMRPTQLIQRNPPMDMDAATYHQILVQAVRTEYDHNMAQQLYIQEASWQLLINAREEVLTLLNSVSRSLENDASAFIYAKSVLEQGAAVPPPSIQLAINMIRNDINGIVKM